MQFPTVCLHRNVLSFVEIAAYSSLRNLFSSVLGVVTKDFVHRLHNRNRLVERHIRALEQPNLQAARHLVRLVTEPALCFGWSRVPNGFASPT